MGTEKLTDSRAELDEKSEAQTLGKEKKPKVDYSVSDPSPGYGLSDDYFTPSLPGDRKRGV